MDSITSSALIEICSHGTTGLTLPSLWSNLSSSSSDINFSPSIKSSLWSRLLKTPALEFRVRNAEVSSSNPSIQRLEDAEEVGVKVVAKEKLRENFLGLYDAQSAIANFPEIQRRVLERLAIARTNGVAQSQLSKEFGKEANYFFYILKQLESRGLIVRQSALVRTKEPFREGESRNGSCITTNMVYLYRYAKQLGSQQKLVVTKEEQSSGNSLAGQSLAGESTKEDVAVRDYVPAMKAICEKLEAVEGKVLVVSDIKKDLGYSGVRGHRDWRTICCRLKDARIVEEFDAKLDGKVRSCLRLLRTDWLETNEDDALGCGNSKKDKEQLKFGRRCQITEQVVELPLEHRVFDMIAAAGSRGLTYLEICERLGINKKKNHDRLFNMFTRFGLHIEGNSHKKNYIYRIWTRNNYNGGSVNGIVDQLEKVDSENKASDGVFSDNSALALVEVAPHPSDGDFSLAEKKCDAETDADLHHVGEGDCKADNMLFCPSRTPELFHGQRESDPPEGMALGTSTNENHVTTLAATPASLQSCRSASHQRYPCLFLTADGAIREQRILERIQDERFILRPELYKWLVSLEKDKCTTTDRKTIDRIVLKLQEQGYCQCVNINVPAITNCSRSRITQVILHPSIQLSPALVSEIHERFRSFEMQTRGHGSSKWKNRESVPVLSGVERIQNGVNSDAGSTQLESMRANGFVLAKMVRAKLLHCFLWDHVHASSNLDHDLSHEQNAHGLNNPHSFCTLFSLEDAIKAIPLELFLQVGGSYNKIDDMIDKCKRGLCLLDLPTQEYRDLMDTQATGRLSRIIDILRRLKLIRLVNNGHKEEGFKIPHAILTHAMELKPYIEEPSSTIAKSLNLESVDLRPRIRHDFFLSNRKAVDEYWQTLEYCYAAAEPRAAVCAFPGSAVNETTDIHHPLKDMLCHVLVVFIHLLLQVFIFKSWTSVRVMTAEQRAKLVKCLGNFNGAIKLPYKECEKLAKDLKLTIEQVLRVKYDMMRKGSSVQGNTEKECQPLRRGRVSATRKRKRSLGELSFKCGEANLMTGRCGQISTEFSDRDALVEEHNHLLHSKDHPAECEDDDHLNHVEHQCPDERNEECSSVVDVHKSSKMKLGRQKRFFWTDEADRQLVIEYAKHRATLGVKFHRADWTSLPNLPGPPSSCAKRMASLKRSKAFRDALMSLCNNLSKRYVKHLQQMREIPLNKKDEEPSARILSEVACGVASVGTRCISPDEERWDDFNNVCLNTALQEVLQLKRMAQLEVSKCVKSVHEEWSNLDIDSEDHDVQDSQHVSSVYPAEKTQKDRGRRKSSHSSRPSRSRRFHQKFIELLNDGICVNRDIYESLAISNAVELFKLVFLSTSKSPEVPNLLAKSLRRYSEHDLYTAFSYLRDRKIMIGGTNNQPFVLSQHFVRNISKSRFPANTSERVARFSGWLQEREKDLNEGHFALPEDLECGDVMYLFALVSSGDLSISPCLPEDGVGEVEDTRTLKRKASNNGAYDSSMTKKLKVISDGEFSSRREKGFPGLNVFLCRKRIHRPDVVEMFKSVGSSTGEVIRQCTGNDISHVDQAEIMSFLVEQVEESLSSSSAVDIRVNVNEAPWHAMASCVDKLISMHSDSIQGSSTRPEVFRSIHSAIQRAGDQGLSIEDISDYLDVPGECVQEVLVEVLQLFGLAVKVNSFDSVRVVDALYRSKYFITSLGETCQGKGQQPLVGPLDRNDIGQNHPTNQHLDANKSPEQMTTNDDQMHKVTILNLPEEVDPPRLEGQANKDEGCKFSSGELCVPIVPWLNGDGTLNRAVYRGLVRRVLGIVMLNPGILEDDIIRQLDVVNPQNCRKLLELMVYDKHLSVRRMYQTTGSGPPSILKSLLGSKFTQPAPTFRKHFFANPMSAGCL